MTTLPKLFNLSLVIKDDNNEETVNAIYDEIVEQCKSDMLGDATIDFASNKAKELMALLDKKFPFFNKSILTTDMCCIFAVLYINMNKICDTLLQIIDTKDNPDTILSDRLNVDNLKEMRNLIDNKFPTPKGHVETAILAPIEDIQQRMIKDEFSLDYDDCLTLNILVNIVYLNIKTLLENENDTDDVLILGKDYKLNVTITDITPIIQETEEETEETEELLLPTARTPIENKANNALSSIMNQIVNIDNNVGIYKEIRNNIDIKLPDINLSDTSKDIIDNIRKTIKGTINTNLVPLEKELAKNCSEVLIDIKNLQDELVRYVAYINNIQKEFNLS